MISSTKAVLFIDFVIAQSVCLETMPGCLLVIVILLRRKRFYKLLNYVIIGPLRAGILCP